MKTLAVALALAVASLTCSSNPEDPPGDGGGVLCPMMYMPGIRIEVYDAVTGFSAACGAAGKAESGGVIQTLSPGPNCQESPGYNYLEGINQPGTYTVTIEAPGYQPWGVNHVDVVSGVCGLVTVGLRADLQPL